MDLSQRVDVTGVTEEELEPFLVETAELLQKRRSQGRIIFDRFMRHRAAVVSAIFLIVMFLFCFVGPFFWQYNPDLIPNNVVTSRFTSPDLAHPFGTDWVARDELARAMAGGKVSLLVALSSMVVALVFGIGIGSFAGFYGGIVDNLLMRFTDVFLSVPLYLLLFVLSATFTDGSLLSVVILISIFGWTYAARLVRGEFLAHRDREYVLAARTIGAKNLSLMFRHILPNAAGPIIVNATLLVGSNIILEAVMSYFGFGIKAPNASWGNMVADGQTYFDQAPWLVFAPALLIFVTVLSFNLVGDGLRDALDPYMTER
ncbi:MAG TPA: ABC transporter permease [Ktedonobacteraceae bacterium]|jgi:peptide/nickel transport system permease protein